MLNKKGFTLVELLAMMVVLGIILATTIPNIVGISNANKLQTYAEDAKKFKSTVEYKLRSDDTYKKPSHIIAPTYEVYSCVAFVLQNAAGSEYDKGPYGGKYYQNASYVVVKKENNEYKYYVQLIEELPDGGYRGFRLRPIDSLEGKAYLEEYTGLDGSKETLWENDNLPNNMELEWYGWNTDQLTYLINRTGCSDVMVEVVAS